MGLKKVAKKVKRGVKTLAHPKRLITHPRRAWRATTPEGKAEYYLQKVGKVAEKVAKDSMTKEQRKEYEDAKSDLKKGAKLLKKAESKKDKDKAKAKELKSEGEGLIAKAMSIFEKLDIEFDPATC